MMYAKEVDLEDWAATQLCWERFAASPHGDKIEGGIGILKPMFLSSIIRADVKIFVTYNGDDIVALVSAQEFSMPCLENGLELIMKPYAFIRAVFSLPSAPRKAVRLLDEKLTEWAKKRGHFMISGNCRLDFPERLARIYGYAPQCLMISKVLGGN